jgi:membrane associated rhomboid family serine protease
LFSAIAFMPLSGGIGILFIPISIPPLVFGVLYIAYEIYMDKRGGTNIAHDAHIGGALFGFLFTLLFVPGAFMNFVNQLISYFN